MAVRTHTPTPSAADRAFARFASSGDPDDVALVFDSTAARLVLVAAHLTGDRHAAEDLVQTTFLEAVRNAKQFEAGRPVLPWLLTILTRRAANERRRRGRAERRGVETEVDGLRSGEAEPIDQLAEREAVERIAEAIDSLAKPYREVLALRHVHGLSAVEIARALDRPLGTVHAQLHRGVERLRGVLPATFAAAFCALLDSPALSACRARVIAAAVAQRVVPPGALILGGFAVSKLAALALALTMLIATLWLVVLPEGAPGEPEKLGEPTESSSVSANRSAEPPSATPAPGLRVAADRKAEPSSVTSELVEEIVMTGRVIAEENGAALPGAEVTIRGYPRHFGDEELPATWSVPEPQSTGPDGRFRLTFRPHAEVGANLRISIPGRIPVTASVDNLRPGIVVDHGDVPLIRGIEVSVRVIDDAGEPVAGYEVSLRGPKAWPRTATGLGPSSGWDTGETDLDGRLPPRLLLPGRWTCSRWPEMGYTVMEPAVVELAANDGHRDLTFRVTRPDLDETVSGVVVDERGVPLIGCELFGAQRELGGRVTTRSRAGGEFFFRAPDPEDGPFYIQLDGDQHDQELLAPLEPIEIGTRDVQVVVRRIRSAPFRMSFVDEGGAPIERFSYACVPVHENSRGTRILARPKRWYGLRLRREAHYAGGVLQRDDLLPGPYVVFLRPEGSTIPRLFSHAIELVEGVEFDERVIMPTLEHWRVRVKDEQGDPVAGSRVEMLQAVGRTRIAADTHVYPQRAVFDRGVHGTYMVVVTGEGRTDGQGELELLLPHSDSAIAARVSGDTHTLGFVAASDPAQRDLRITVRRAATIRGVLTPLEVVHAWGPSVEKRAAANISTGGLASLDRYRPQVSAVELNAMGKARRVSEVPVGDDGRFELGPVPEGSWQLHLNVKVRVATGLYGHSINIGEVLRLGPGEVRELAIDVSDAAPVRFRGRALLDGEPVRGARIWFRGTGTPTGARTDDEGDFETLASVPGRYLPSLSLEGEVGSSTAIPSTVVVEAYAGQVVELTLSFTRRRLELHLTDADGEPVGNRYVSLRVAEHSDLDWNPHARTTRRTDPEGRVVFPTAPPLTCEVLVWNRHVVRDFDTMEENGEARCTVLGHLAPDDGVEAVIVLQLPR